MPALISEEVPFGFSPWDFHFIESYQFKCEEGKIRWVLVGSTLKGFRPRISIPLLAGDLTSPTGRAFGRIYEKGFVCH